MSHFIKLKTNITEEELLIKTLDNLKLDWTKQKILVKQYNNECYSNNIIVKYQNSEQGGFFKKNDSYELQYDEMFWTLPITISLFFEKINSYYALNLITKNLSENGFSINNILKENEHGSIKVKLNGLRFN